MAGSNFVDYVKIFARSGHGGSGSAHFRREKFVEFGGPDGGDGGRGGHIILRGDSQYWTLIHLKYQRHQFAEDGEGGSGARSSGKNGKDIVIPVPLGTVARRVLEDGTTEYAGEVTADGEELVLLKGGRGGLGNWHFKTSTNQAPRYAQPGEDRQEGTFILELKVLADVGLVGFPNAGKSTLLSVVSAAKPKIANYHFTTLTPNLGVVKRYDKSFVLADIPGLIEGAAEGAGLGHDFLRHIERTRVLVHVIDVSGSEGRDPVDDYFKIKGELTRYSPRLGELKQVVAANKMDITGAEDNLARLKEALKDEGVEVFPVSAATVTGFDALIDCLVRTLATLPKTYQFEEEEINVGHKYEPGFNIERDGDVFVVTGGSVDYILDTTYADDEGSMRRFQQYLIKEGIIDALRAAGANENSVVRMGDWEFDFVE